MFTRIRFFLGLYREMKDTPEIPQVTNFLDNSKAFEKISLNINNLKLKAWQKLDEAAFPEEYENKKYIEQKNGQQSQYTNQNNYNEQQKQNQYFWNKKQ